MNEEKKFSFLLTEKSEAIETSCAITGTNAVLEIALIAFGLGYIFASSKKKAL